VRNFVLKHGSLRGFFDHHQADIVCLQVSRFLWHVDARTVLACVKRC